ncbi:MAG: EAL domain-containing protein [Pseudomonadota bacterium]
MSAASKTLPGPLPTEQASLFLAAGVGTWRWEDTTREFTVSPETAAMLEVREEDLPLTLRSVLASLHEDDIPLFEAALANVVESGGIDETLFRVYLDDGELRWYRAVGEAHRNESGRIESANGLLIDVTRQRRAEEMHRSFFEQPHGLHLITDTEGRIVDANSAWHPVLGYAADELVDRLFIDLVHVDDREATRAQLKNLSCGIKTLAFENRCRHRDGGWRLIAWSTAIAENDLHIYGAGMDITAQRAAEQRLSKAAAVFDSSGEGILVTDNEGYIREVNDAFSQITGYAREDAIGEHTRLLRSGQHDDAFYGAMWNAITERGVWRGEIWNRRKSGEVFPELLTITRIDGAEGGFVAVFTDISKMKETEEHLMQLAHYDQLTGLPNRYLITERLSQALRRARRHSRRVAVVFLDLDCFKNVNDSLGHAAGDQLITSVAQRLNNALRDEDNIGRIGGDEFLIVIEELPAARDMTTIAEKLVNELREPIDLHGRSITVGASLGISLYPDDGSTAETLMSHADAAMYSAKEQGRDTFRFYSQRMTQNAFQHVLLDTALREAISNNELRLVFQAQRNLDDGSVEGLEALLRWRHSTLGMVPPSQFIPHAESTGLIFGIGRWVLEQACVQAARWHAENLDFGRITVNISATQFRDEDFLGSVTRALDASGLAPEHLELEITESMLGREPEALIEKMLTLRNIGVCFAIDDFGTGYSSLRYLQHMPIDRFKLDRSIVRDVISSSTDRSIAAAAIALGDAMGVPVIAEGIETEAQAQCVIDLGCAQAQGDYYGKPLSDEAMRAWLQDRASEPETDSWTKPRLGSL